MESSMRRGRTGIQLAYPFELKRLSKWPAPWLMQPKLDGERCRVWYERGRVLLISSTGEPFMWLEHLEQAVADMCQACGVAGYIELDGEIYTHGKHFQEIHSLASRTTNPHKDRGELELHLFDIILPLPQYKREDMLGELIKFNSSPHLHKVESRFVSSINEVMERCDNYLERGYEGFILREANAEYVRRRSIWMMKYKEGREDTYKIVGVLPEVSEEGIERERVGALVCQVEGEVPFRVACGKGVTHEVREELWSRREELVGMEARIVYQNLTKSGIPRHGRFVEVISTMEKTE